MKRFEVQEENRKRMKDGMVKENTMIPRVVDTTFNLLSLTWDFSIRSYNKHYLEKLE